MGIEHLDFAIKEFREMKMQPSLERALRRKDILKAEKNVCNYSLLADKRDYISGKRNGSLGTLPPLFTNKPYTDEFQLLCLLNLVV